jgi:Tfp pilus assembly major pilin PilA
MRQVNYIARNRGQGMTEYIIIVALIAVSAIGVFTFFGQTAREQVAGLATELSGENASSVIRKAAGAADDAQDQANAAKGLGSYNGNDPKVQ